MEENKKQGWRVKSTHEGIYTGGKVEISAHQFMVCLISDNIGIISLKTGRLLFKLQKEEEELDDDIHVGKIGERFTTFCVHPEGRNLITASENQLIRRWNIGDLLDKKLKEEQELEATGGVDNDDETDVSMDSILMKHCKEEFPEMVRSWRGHEGPIVCADFHSKGDLFATGSSDFTVKVWSMKGSFCTHNFRGHRAVITQVRFHPSGGKLVLASGDHSGLIHVWNLLEQTTQGKGKESKHMRLENHVGAVTSMCFSETGDDMMFSSGRDKVVSIWKRGKLVKTLPVMESVEGMVLLKGNILATAGEKGMIRLWHFNPSTNEIPCTLVQPSEGTRNYMGLVKASNGEVAGLTLDCMIQFYNPTTLELTRQLVGFHDEIIALEYLTGKSEIVMATNSENVTIMNLDTFDSRLMIGHKDVVLCLGISRDGGFVITGSKDNTARIWEVKSNRCVAVCKGHTQAVTAVAFLQLNEAVMTRLAASVSKKRQRSEEDGNNNASTATNTKLTPAIVISAGADKTLKYWAMQTRGPSEGEMICRHTHIAHEKAINAVATSPNFALIATGSQDKSVKLWQTNGFEYKGVLRGHRRGVWDVQFSPVERCLVSASADKTLRIWSIADLSCISVLEGHATSAIAVRYFPGGQKLVSAASNGVLKMWSVSKGECVETMEYHTDKVWALALKESGEECKEMLSGGGDSKLVVWKDCTQQIDLLQKKAEEETILHEQELRNCLRNKDYLRAAMRALELNHTFQFRVTIESMIRTNRESDIDKFIANLDEEQLLRCWELVRDWNTFSRNCCVSQIFIQHLLKAKIPLGAWDKVKSIVDPIYVYSERHFQRMDRLVKETYLLDHALNCMGDETLYQQ